MRKSFSSVTFVTSSLWIAFPAACDLWRCVWDNAEKD
jgi:hypothetical protein